MKKNRIVLRADGDGKIGYGHLFRMLALTEMFVGTYPVVLITGNHERHVKKMFHDAGAKLINLLGGTHEQRFELDGLIQGTDIVILDGYHFSHDYQRDVHQAGCRQICIDDLDNDYPYADAIVNHASANANRYAGVNTLSCYGLAYAMLRKDFFRPLPDRNNRSATAFVCFGGADTNGCTAGITEMLMTGKLFGSFEVLYSDKLPARDVARLQKLAATGIVNLHQNIDSGTLVNILDRCTHAFVPSSTILMESFFRGLECFTFITAGNQVNAYDFFTGKEGVTGFGDIKVLKQGELLEQVERKMRRPVNIPVGGPVKSQWPSLIENIAGK